jgi:hypothetical protein
MILYFISAFPCFEKPCPETFFDRKNNIKKGTPDMGLEPTTTGLKGQRSTD